MRVYKNRLKITECLEKQTITKLCFFLVNFERILLCFQIVFESLVVVRIELFITKIGLDSIVLRIEGSTK